MGCSWTWLTIGKRTVEDNGIPFGGICPDVVKQRTGHPPWPFTPTGRSAKGYRLWVERNFPESLPFLRAYQKKQKQPPSETFFLM
jgi:hypothetical protein